MRIAIAIMSVTAMTVAVFAGSNNQNDAIKKAALDYVEGWYDGNAERMENALHVDLAKRVLMPDPRSKHGKIEHMSAMRLVKATRNQRKHPTPTEKRTANITILDVDGNAASVKAEMHDWIDYMHLSKVGDQWKIVNVLWEPKPEAKKAWGFPEGF